MEIAKTLIFASFITLQACGEKFYEQRPFNVSQPNQTFRTKFDVKEEYDYRFALIFNWTKSNNFHSRERQNLLVGSGDSKGLPLPMIITITRDGKAFLDRAIQTDTSWHIENFCYNQKTGVNDPRPGFWEDLLSKHINCESIPNRRRISGPSRTLEIRTLPPGSYQVEIKTLISVEEFSDMDTFIGISPYSPKI